MLWLESSSAPPCGAGGKSRRVAGNGASGRFELDWRWRALAQNHDITVFHEASIRKTT
jgi:hypothetical protein